MSVHQTKDGRWFVVYYLPGRIQKRKYFGRGDKAEENARRWDKATRTTRIRNGSATVSQLANRFLSAKASSVAETTLRNWIWKFNSVINPALGHIPAAGLTPEHLDQYAAARLQTVKRTTVHTEITTIQALLNWAVSRGFLTRNPVAGYQKPRRDDAIIDPPTEAELARILSKAAEHLKRAILLAYMTGTRPGAAELLGLKYGDINWKEQTITIRSAHKGGPAVRRIPLHPELAIDLKVWYEAAGKRDDAYIISYRGRKIGSLKTAWRRAKERAGISRRIRLYDLRHAAITSMLINGADLKTVSEIAGHSRVDTTLAVYSHSNPDAARAAISTIPSPGQYKSKSIDQGKS